jgi:hypothetical protein
MVGERPKPFGQALGFDPIKSTLIFRGTMRRRRFNHEVAEAEALAIGLLCAS